jgi:7-cyano-7-deazaguanine synthase
VCIINRKLANPQKILKSPNPHPQISAVLLSGGLDSAVLLVEEAARGEVQPIYVGAGLAWEQAERDAIARLLASGRAGRRVRPLVSLSVDMRDVYLATHWSIQGRPPAYHTPDEDVYLPGRNIVLLGKAGVYCAAAGLGRLVIGTLAHNPFPDATPEFARRWRTRCLRAGAPARIEALCRLSSGSRAPGRQPRVPRAHVVVYEAAGRPLHTRTGPSPACGGCSKCRERHDAFLEAGLTDTTDYADKANIQ